MGATKYRIDQVSSLEVVESGMGLALDVIKHTSKQIVNFFMAMLSVFLVVDNV